MVKRTLLIMLVASCGALGQRPDTPAAVRRILGGQQPAPAQAAPAPAAHVETTSAAAPAPVIVSNSSNVAGEKTVAPGEIITARKPTTGKRDPFVNPISSGSGALPASNCSSGKRCLVIDQIVLRGVVKTATGMIAVVANSVNKAYFLRENDPVFNGYVVRITGDSVVFKENTKDQVGRQGAREVVKKVTPPSV